MNHELDPKLAKRIVDNADSSLEGGRPFSSTPLILCAPDINDKQPVRSNQPVPEPQTEPVRKERGPYFVRW